ncbi:MAG: hypothetical protein K6G80_11190 [Treponema sp.]|nr:hypothetical protein [Treponema sp.]
MSDKQTAAEAFGAFADKLQRFISAGGESPKAPARPRTAQESLNAALSDQKKAVITRYKAFLTPDAAVAKDEAELVAAYELYKSVQEANAEHATSETSLDGIPLKSPLSHADRYTLGGDFIYLQCWLQHEKGCTDYVPELQPQNEGTDSWRLTFVPARHHRITSSDKEKLDTICECFYPAR